MITILYVATVLLLVLANGFFVASEFALVGVRRSRIETLVAQGSNRARRLIKLLDNLNAYISATQLGITMASLALGWIGEPVFAHFARVAAARIGFRHNFAHDLVWRGLYGDYVSTHRPRRIGAEDAGPGTCRIGRLGNLLADGNVLPDLFLADTSA
jgi:hypothetical protein